MKKSLFLAVALALGVTASACAANPFSDVPAGHWAYDSISKLAATGVVEGYGDDTFRGDRLMTRFEMAQIVAKAMAKGANVNRLAAEFADELDGLGIRVAALEKKSDNIKVTGEVTVLYAAFKDAARSAEKAKRHHGIRTRLYFTGKINDNWNYVGRLENTQWTHDNVGNEDTEFNVAKAEGRLGGVKVIAGRDDDEIADGYIYDGEQDIIKLSYGDKWYLSGAYGKLTDTNDDISDMVKTSFHAEAGTNMDSFINGKAGYLKTKLDTNGKNFAGRDNIGIWYVGADLRLTDDLGLNAMYLRSDLGRHINFNSRPLRYDKITKDGYVVGLSYKGAEDSKPGTWGLTANYYHQGRGTYLVHTIDGFTDYYSGFKGWSVGGDVTLAKNMVLDVTYYDTKALNESMENPGSTKAKVLWTELDITF